MQSMRGLRGLVWHVAWPEEHAGIRPLRGTFTHVHACRLIYTLREYPNTEDFVYLRRMDRNPSEYDPYALEVRTGSQQPSRQAGDRQ